MILFYQVYFIACFVVIRICLIVCYSYGHCCDFRLNIKDNSMLFLFSQFVTSQHDQLTLAPVQTSEVLLQTSTSQ